MRKFPWLNHSSLKAVSGRLREGYLRNMRFFIEFSCDHLLRIIQTAQHCFPIPLPSFCFKKLLQLHVGASSQS